MKFLGQSVQFSSVAQSCLTLCDPMDCSMPGLPVHHQFLELTQTHVHWVGDRWTISSSVVPFSFYLQSFSASGSFPMSQFSSDGQSMFSFSISPSNEHPGMISFRMDWLDLLAVQGTLKSLLQHRSLKASILQCSAFFIAQLSTTTQLHSFHMLARSCSKFSKLGFNSSWTEKFQIYKLDFKKAEEPGIKLPTFIE